jgi:hypothetical protein
MVIVQALSQKFVTANADIELRWVVLEENVLRQRATTDISSQDGQFDVVKHLRLKISALWAVAQGACIVLRYTLSPALESSFGLGCSLSL